MTVTVIVSQGYTPPELMRERVRVGAYSDIYSLGMTLYSLLSLKYPPTLIDRLTDDNFNYSVDSLNISSKLKDIIKSMTDLKVENRIGGLVEIEKAPYRTQVK